MNKLCSLFLIIFSLFSIYLLACAIKNYNINTWEPSIKLDNISIRTTLWVEDNLPTIKKTIKYYKQNYSDCNQPVDMIFLDVSSFIFNKQEAVGSATWDDPSKVDTIQVAVKDRHLCKIIETTIHELRHVCEGLRDCYDNWDNCWAKDLHDKTDIICINVLTTVEE